MSWWPPASRTGPTIQHMMNLCDFDGRPLVGDLNDPLLERLRAVHGEPRRYHHNGRREPAEDGRVAAKKTSGDR